MSKCKTPNCKCSTGIHEGLTFGAGRLDRHGFWEFPCRECAVEHDRDRPRLIEKLISEFRLKFDWQGLDDYNFIEPQIIDYLKRHHEWAFLPAWPYAKQDLAQLTKEFQEDNAAELAADEEFEREMQEMFPDQYEMN